MKKLFILGLLLLFFQHVIGMEMQGPIHGDGDVEMQEPIPGYDYLVCHEQVSDFSCGAYAPIGSSPAQWIDEGVEDYTESSQFEPILEELENMFFECKGEEARFNWGKAKMDQQKVQEFSRDMSQLLNRLSKLIFKLKAKMDFLRAVEEARKWDESDDEFDGEELGDPMDFDYDLEPFGDDRWKERKQPFAKLVRESWGGRAQDSLMVRIHNELEEMRTHYPELWRDLKNKYGFVSNAIFAEQLWINKL